jgi:hypothetical protein
MAFGIMPDLLKMPRGISKRCCMALYLVLCGTFSVICVCGSSEALVETWHDNECTFGEENIDFWTTFSSSLGQLSL